MKSTYQVAKRLLDLSVAVAGLVSLGMVIAVAAMLARLDTGGSGIFCQQRIGRGGRLFWIYKIRTMTIATTNKSTITTATDARITRLGRFLRRWKIDELPQLFNVLKGDMSLVGPRPEVPEYLEVIRRDAPIVLSVRPGITGPATLAYRQEESLLAAQEDPVSYNDRVVFPDKLRLNADYIQQSGIVRDLYILWQTVVAVRQSCDAEAILVTHRPDDHQYAA